MSEHSRVGLAVAAFILAFFGGWAANMSGIVNAQGAAICFAISAIALGYIVLVGTKEWSENRLWASASPGWLRSWKGINVGGKRRFVLRLEHLATAIVILACAAGIYDYAKISRPAATSQEVAGLNQLYAESDGLYRRTAIMPPNISDSDYAKLQTEIEGWSMRLENYVYKNFGKYETSRLLETSADVPVFRPEPQYRETIAKDRAATLYALALTRHNLARLIEKVGQ